MDLEKLSDHEKQMKAATENLEVTALLSEHGISAEDAADPDKYGHGEHITMIWDDGEITSQKAGSLLWQRTLHQFERPVTRKNGFPMVWLPEAHTDDTDGWDGHRYAFVTAEGAYLIRRIILLEMMKWLTSMMEYNEASIKTTMAQKETK